MTLTCPSCGHEFPSPPLLPKILRAIFDYLIAHPRASAAEIEAAVYGKHPRPSNVIYANISHLGYALQSTPYRVFREGRGPRRYSITQTHAPPAPAVSTAQQESPVNGNV